MPKRRKNYRRKKRYRKVKSAHTTQQQDKEVIYTGKHNNDVVLYKGIGIPPMFYTKLKYNQVFSFTAPYSEQKMRGSSLFDPDLSGVGTQPMYFDELSALYDKYNVYASSIVVTFTNRTATGESSFCKVGIYPLTEQTTAGALNRATERDQCYYAQLGPNNGDQGIITIKHFAKTQEVLGRGENQTGDDIQEASVLSNPLREFVWHIFAGTLDGLSAVTMYADVTMTYYCKFFERVQVGRS